jgi:hypothetical protein
MRSAPNSTTSTAAAKKAIATDVMPVAAGIIAIAAIAGAR